MSFEPDPEQTLLMLRLVFGPAEPKLSQLRFKSAGLRAQLQNEGLIRLEKRGKSSHVLVTDKGWQWTQEHLHSPFNPQSADAGRVLLELLPRLQRFLARKGCALAELFEADAASPDLPPARLHAVLLALGGGRIQQRLTLLQVRAALPQFAAGSVDRALLQLQQNGTIALYHEDDPQRCTAELDAAAIRVAGSTYHLVYLLA